MVATRCPDLKSSGDMEAFKLRLSRAVSGDSDVSGASSAKLRGRRSALSAFQFRRANISKNLLAASEKGNATRVRELIDGGVDFGDIDDTDAAVSIACEKGHLDVLATLIRYGAAVNSLADDGRTSPLHIAVRNGFVSVILLLIGNGANVNLRTKFERRSPLHVAALKGRQEAVRVLLEADSRIDPDVADIYGSTPLHLATAMGHSPVVETLLGWNGKSADVNAYDNEGWTALHLAAERGDTLMAELLLDHNAQVDCQNKYGRTPLHWATIRRHADMVELLLNHEASPTLKDLHNKSARDYADQPEIARLLHDQHVTSVPCTHNHMRSTIGGFMKMAVRQSFINRLSGPIPRDSTWPESIVSLKHRPKNPERHAEPPGGALGKGQHADDNADDLDVIAEEDTAQASRRSSGSREIVANHSVQDRISDDDGVSLSKVSLFRALFGKNRKGSLPSQDRFDVDSDVETQSTSTILPPGLFDREESVESGSSVNGDHVTSSSVASRCQTPDSFVGCVPGRCRPGAGSDNVIGLVAPGSPASVKSDNNNKPAQSELPEEALIAQSQFQTLMTKVERHQVTIETMIRAASEKIEKAATGKNKLSDGDLKQLAAMMHKTDDLMFDFKEDVSQQAKLVKDTMRAFLATIEPRLSPHDLLPLWFYHGFFHSVVSYLSERPYGSRFLIQKMSGISEEKRSDLLQVLSSCGPSKLFQCSQAVYFALEFMPVRYKQTPLLGLLKPVIKCQFEEDTVRKILKEFISLTNPNLHGCLDQRKLFSLSHRLRSDGQALANQLGLPQSRDNGVVSNSSPAKRTERWYFEYNLEVFSRWRQLTAHSATSGCVLQLVESLIFIGREDLLVWILGDQKADWLSEEADC